MANKINKVVDRNGSVLIDLTNDTIKANKVLAGTTFHGPDGRKYTGSLPANELDVFKYNFVDYDGELMYTYTDEELDALTELPVGPDHTDENLTFQGWNWTLEDLKAWNRERPDRPIVGAHYITTDRKSYLYMDTPYSGASLSFTKYGGTLNSVDWGDGTVDTNTSHTYANPGQYTVIIDLAEGGYWYTSNTAVSASTNQQWVTKIKLGNMKNISDRAFANWSSLTSITIPNTITSIKDGAFTSCYSLKSINIPNGITTVVSNTFSTCFSLTSVTIPDSVTSIGQSAFTDCRTLTSVVLPDGVASIGNYVFQNCFSLTSVTIPDSVTSIGSYAFGYCYSLKSINIPNGITTIRERLLTSCNSLTSVTIPDSATKIEYGAFSECRSLKSINIPDSVTSIGTSVFDYCYSLTVDLSKQTKVIPLSGDISLTVNRNKILVPAALLDQYKAASYWSKYADCMVGV